MSDDLTCTGCGEYAGIPIADRIEELEAKLTKAMQVIEAYEEDEGYVPRRVVSLYEELKGQNDLDQ